MKTKAWFILLCVLGPVFARSLPISAQTVPPALMIEQDGKSVPLGLTKMRTEVRIVGLVAQTRSTMTFSNSLPRVMEGNLYFPLPEGATISGYALDIDGKMVDGVAVEKHEARRVFEEVVRRGVDPGLIEWTKGNNFQTRVFPIPAGGSRTIRVEYVTELTGKELAEYRLPLAFKKELPEFSLRVEVVGPVTAPTVPRGELANFAFEKRQDCYIAETSQRNVDLVEDLVIAIPNADKPQVVVERADDGQFYFAIHDIPAAPSGQTSPDGGRPGQPRKTKHVVVFWDASGSRAGDHQREIVLLHGYLARLLPEAADQEPKIATDLVFFRDAPSRPVRIDVSKSNLATLSAELNKVQYDGGTQLGAIGPIAGEEKPDLYLLFTDGLSNFGREEPRRLDAPLMVFSASAAANHSLLHSLAMANGGQYFNLGHWKDDDILAAAGRSPWSFLSASIESGNAQSETRTKAASDLYPQRAQPIAGRFTLVGRLPVDQATVTVTCGVQGGRSEQRRSVVSRSAAAEGSVLRRLWAQKKLAELMIFEKRNQKEITALGKEFAVVTPHTSLLVLDSLEQYVQYEIAPPKSLHGMRDEYLRRVDTLEHQQQKQKADKLAEVVRLWEARVKWWETEFKYPKDFQYVEQKALPGPGGSGGGTPTSAASPSRRHTVDDARPAEAPALHPMAPAPAPPPASQPAVQLMQRGTHPQADSVRELTEAARDEADAAGRKDEGRSNRAARQPGIAIQPWNPETPYLKELRAAAGKSDWFEVYMKNRTKHGTAPAFFLDCADYFREMGQSDLAIQVLSNVAELELADPALLRVLGYRLLQLGQLDLAVQTFEQVLDLRPEEPQSCRDLALTLARRADEAIRRGDVAKDAIRSDYSRAIDLFVRVVLTRWDQRFAEIELIALEEVNQIIPRAKAAGVSDIPLDPRLIRLLDVDARIVMTWQADATDIDLWVTEPSAEKAFYGHNRTTIGGLVSRDFTGGYGPEEYMVRRAAHGTYKIAANYFGSRATRLLGAVTVQVDVFTNFGRENQQCKSLTLRLKDAKETVPIGEIEF